MGIMKKNYEELEEAEAGLGAEQNGQRHISSFSPASIVCLSYSENPAHAACQHCLHFLFSHCSHSASRLPDLSGSVSKRPHGGGHQFIWAYLYAAAFSHITATSCDSVLRIWRKTIQRAKREESTAKTQCR